MIERLLQHGDIQAAYKQAHALLKKVKTVGPQAYSGADYDLAMAHGLFGRVLRTSGQADFALKMYIESELLFENLDEKEAERMVSLVLTEQADCLCDLGRLDEATEIYIEAIKFSEKSKDHRQLAVCKGQLAMVRLIQERYQDSLTGYDEVRAIFEGLDEPTMVATTWHQIGVVHGKAGYCEEAEKACLRSLKIYTQINNRAGQANSLGLMGNIYINCWNRPEEAIKFYRQAANIYVELGDVRYEGAARNNIAGTLLKLKRHGEARQEISRAIECAEEIGLVFKPWKTLNILQKIELAESHHDAAKAAWRDARNAYLAYRRQEGYAQADIGKLTDKIAKNVQQGKTKEVVQELTEIAEAEDTPGWLKVAAAKFLAVLNGSRDPALADDPALDYDDAAEVLFLIERLEG
jgi:tetratricopeptide (TPR) repeat protein